MAERLCAEALLSLVTENVKDFLPTLRVGRWREVPEGS
jgi:hypothetical protein